MQFTRRYRKLLSSKYKVFQSTKNSPTKVILVLVLQFQFQSLKLAHYCIYSLPPNKISLYCLHKVPQLRNQHQYNDIIHILPIVPAVSLFPFFPGFCLEIHVTPSYQISSIFFDASLNLDLSFMSQTQAMLSWQECHRNDARLFSV